MSEELLSAAKERIADLVEPINGGVGEDVSYDEKFDQIKAETEKLQSLAGETCNWGEVAVAAEELLQDKAVRLCEQAYAQGGLLSNCDLAELLATSDSRIFSATGLTSTR